MKNKTNKIKKKKLFDNSKIIFIFIIISLFLILDYLQRSHGKNSILNKSNDINDIKVCVCTLAKLENKYIREFVQHYEKYGVDKIFLYDNNDINGEKFEEVINDYIQNGFVEILNWRGKYQAMMKIMNDCYQKNYNTYDWLIFYEIDEHIHLYNYKNVKLFLNQTKFNDCQEIYLNLVCHTDNNLLYYEDKPLAKRFPQIVPETKLGRMALEMKSIIRGHIKKTFLTNNHLGDLNLKSCNSSGLHEKLNGHYSLYRDEKYYFIDHYYSKSTEEFIKKLVKGDAIRNDPQYIYERVDKYFSQSEPTKEKLDMIEKIAHINLKKYRKKIK